MTSGASSSRTVVLSGATGFLGSALCRHFASRGYRVRGLARDPAAPPAGLEGVEWYACCLPDLVDEEVFAGAPTAFVHCAFETRLTDPARARAVNVEGSRKLFDLCRTHGVERVLFISSLSAHHDALSLYGRTKLEVEAMLDPKRDTAIRPGHIIGEGGVFWRTARSIASLPFVPLFFGGRQRIQTVWLEDVCEAIRLALEGGMAGILRVAEPEPVGLREFYAAVAEHLGRTAHFLPLPGEIVLRALRIAERFRFQLPLSSDNMLGLKRLQTFDVSEDLARLGLRVRTMPESLAQVQWNRL